MAEEHTHTHGDGCCDHDHGHAHQPTHEPGSKEYKDPLSCPCGCGDNKGGSGGWLMVVGILVVIGLIVALKYGTTPMEDGLEGAAATPSGSGFNSLTVAKGVRIALPAAAATDVTEPFSLRNDPPAGAADPVLYVGPEKWNDSWKEKVDAGQVKAEDFAKGHPKAEYPGFAKIAFDAPKTAKYELWLRAYWVDQCGDSMDIAVDDADPRMVNDSNHGRWVWTPLRSGEGRPIPLALEAGPHTLTLLNREDDCYVAKVLLREVTGSAEPPPAETD